MTRPTPTQALLNAITSVGNGIAVVRWPSFDLREWLRSEVRSLLPIDSDVTEVSTVDEALAAPDRVVILVPSDEREVMADLEGSRDLFLDRTQPVVLFLARDGDGVNLLRTQPSLASWIRGNDVDYDELSEIDVAAERARFVEEVGEDPDAWLRRWDAGDVERTGATYERAYWASMLVPP